MSIIADGHDNICNCPCPFAHLLASIFPPGHQDRNKTIDQILTRDYLQLCHSGGEGEENHGGEPSAAGGFKGIKEEEEPDLGDADDLLMAAVAAAEEKQER